MLTKKAWPLPGLLLAVLLAAAVVAGCGEKSGPTEAELAALNEIFGQSYMARDLAIQTGDIMNKERQNKFAAVKKVFTTPSGDYALISKPIAYNGPVTLAVGIDREAGAILGMRIVEHMETEHYVRDMTSKWFTGRFRGKSTAACLELVRLAAARDNEIVAITGATVTTEAIVNGVNACVGVFRESALGEDAAAVPYMVKFEKEAGEGPFETGALAIRSYGVVLGEVTLAEIKEMPSVRRTMAIHSTAGTTNHSFRGTLLANVIAAVDPGLLTIHGWVQPVGVDDYMSHIAMEEVLAENAVYVMYEDNGAPLMTKNGEPGAMRVVVLDDVFGQRFTNYMIEIVLE